MRGAEPRLPALDPGAPLFLSLEEEIAAPPREVWDRLASIHRWPERHPGIRFALLRGALAPGTALHWTADGMRISSTIVEVEAERRLGWTIHTFGGRGYLRWSLEGSSSGGTRVRLEESWEGIAVRLLRGTLRKTLRRSRGAWLAGLDPAGPPTPRGNVSIGENEKGSGTT